MTFAAASIPKLLDQTTPVWNLKIADLDLPSLDVPLEIGPASDPSYSSTEVPFYEMGQLPWLGTHRDHEAVLLGELHRVREQGQDPSDSSTDRPYRNDQQRSAGRRYRIRFLQHVTNTGRPEVLLVDFGEVQEEVETDPQVSTDSG